MEKMRRFLELTNDVELKEVIERYLGLSDQERKKVLSAANKELQNVFLLSEELTA